MMFLSVLHELVLYYLRVEPGALLILYPRPVVFTTAASPSVHFVLRRVQHATTTRAATTATTSAATRLELAELEHAERARAAMFAGTAVCWRASVRVRVRERVHAWRIGATAQFASCPLTSYAHSHSPVPSPLP